MSQQVKAFTLIEVLISVSLIVLILAVGIKTFHYFSREAKLQEVRELIDTMLVYTNVQAITGKSEASDYYQLQGTKDMQASRYFLHLEKTESWKESNQIIYGELQEYDNGIYELVFEEKKEIPFPVFIADILFTDNEINNYESLQNNVFIFFDPPFAQVSFLSDVSSQTYLQINENFVNFKDLNAIKRADYKEHIFLKINDEALQKGSIEIALQYKDNASEERDDKHNLLREYIEYDSRNQISHYWD